MKSTDTLQPELDRIGGRALRIGGAALAASLVVALFSAERFFQGYLYAYLFWTNLTLGCLGLLMLHHLVGGGWGFAIQRLLEAAARMMPVMAVLFVPLIFGLQELYPWARPELVAHDTMLQHKSAYLNPRFFVLRAALYLAIWSAIAYLLTRWSRDMDRPGNERRAKHLESLSGPGIVVYVLTATFAATDWGMSLEPHWYSTIYGFLFVVGQGLAALAFATLCIRVTVRHEPLSGVVGAQQVHDLGNLMLAFVMLWTYMSLSQFLITWSANLPEEVPWYISRTSGGWHVISILLILFHFALPFLLLLSRGTKRNITMLSRVAMGIFGMRALELFWLVAPAYAGSGLVSMLVCALAWLGVGGVWLGLYARELRSLPLLPLHDPRLEEAFDHHG